MSQFIPPHQAIALVVFPLLFSNLWQLFRTRTGITTLRKYWVLVALLALSLWLTTFFTARVPAGILLSAIGIAIVIYAISSLARPTLQLPDNRDGVGQIVTGLAAGIMGGLTSIWSPPLVTYLIARRTDNEEFVRAAGLFIFVGGIPLAIGFWQTGLLNGATAPLSAAMIVPSLVGFTIGEYIRRRLEPERFRQVVLWIFLLMGLNLLRKALF